MSRPAVFPRARVGVSRQVQTIILVAGVFPRARGSVLYLYRWMSDGEGLPARAWECPNIPMGGDHDRRSSCARGGVSV